MEVPANTAGTVLQAHNNTTLNVPVQLSMQCSVSRGNDLNSSSGSEMQQPALERMIQNESQQIDTTLLRRSTRCNKYDGFRVPPPTDRKLNISKVKPRKQPFVQCSSTATAPSEPGNGKVTVDIPPPTSITTIQNIGTNMCGIPSDHLSPKRLLASLQEDSESS